MSWLYSISNQAKAQENDPVFATFATDIEPQDDEAKIQPDDIGTRQAGSDWPGFLGPNRDGKSSEKGILKDWTNGKLRVIWSREISETYSAPSVSRGRLFFFEKADGKNVLRCLNAENGESIWEFEYESDYRDSFGYNNGPRCSPVVDGRRVYVYGPEGKLHCLDVKTGAVVWKSNPSKQFGVVQNFFGVGSTPIVHKDLLICMVGGSPPDSQDVPQLRLDLVKPNGSGVVAFDKTNGKVRYKILNDLASYSSLVVKTLNGNPTAFAFLRSGLVAFDPDSGATIDRFDWRSPSLESVNASTPIFVGDQVFISECYGVGSALLELKNNKLKTVWTDDDRDPRSKTLLAHWNTPIEVGGTVYASSGRNSGDAILKAIDLKTRKIVWEKKRLSRSTLTAIDNHLIVLTEYGRLFLISAKEKEFNIVTEWDFSGGGEKIGGRLTYPCWAAPVVSHGLMYILSGNRLICLELIPK